MSQQQCDINRRMGDMQLPITSAAKQNTYRMMKHSEIDSLPGETYSKSIYVEQVFDYLIIYTHRTLKELVIRASALKTGKCQFWTFPKILPLLLYPVFYSSDTVYLIQTQHSSISPGVKTISFPIMTLLPVACHRLDQGFPNYWDGETRVNLYPLPPAIPTCPIITSQPAVQESLPYTLLSTLFTSWNKHKGRLNWAWPAEAWTASYCLFLVKKLEATPETTGEWQTWV